MKHCAESIKEATRFGLGFPRPAIRWRPVALAKRLVHHLARIAQLPSGLQSAREHLLRVSLTTSLERDESCSSATCPICGSVVSAPGQIVRRPIGLFDIGPIVRYRCGDCDAVFGPMSVMAMASDRLIAEYKLLYSVYSEPDTTRYQLETFRALRPRQSEKILNYACGNWKKGIRDLLSEGFDVYGYEPCLPKQHPRIATSLAELSAGSFNCVFSHNYIEHVQSPIEQFVAWKRLLGAGGRMAHSTACFQYLFDESPFHVCYLLGRSMERLAERVGLQICERHTRGQGSRDEFMEIVVLAASGTESREAR